jgi:hypothetical protein
MLQKNSDKSASEGPNAFDEVLSRVGEVTSLIFGGIGRKIERSVTNLFGSSNARFMKKLQPTVQAIAALEPKFQEMTDAELRDMTPQVPQASGRRRNAGRHLGRSLRRLPRGGPPRVGHEALRRADDGRHRAAPGEHR